MKSTINSRTLIESKRVGQIRRVFNTVVTAFLLTIIIVLPGLHMISNLYITYDTCTHLNKTLPMLLGEKSLDNDKLKL